MRVLITSIPQVSHMFPIVPTAQALQAAGHEVMIVTEPSVAPALAATGLAVETIGMAVDLVTTYHNFLPPGALPAAAWQFDLDQMNKVAASRWAQWAREVLGAQLKLAAQWRPDLIICDPMEIAALITGAVLNVPVVAHRWGPATTGAAFRATAARRMASLLRRHGLAGLPAPALVLDPCPPSIRLPGAEPGHPVRYIPYNGTGALPAGALAGDRPRVGVSFGRVSASLAGGALLRWTLEALDQITGIDVALVVTRKDLEGIGPVPGYAEVLLDVPLHLIAGQCDVLVHHGGSGTGMTGLCAGVPQVILPQIADQVCFGQLVRDFGAGCTLADPDSQQSTGTVRAAISAVLEDPGYPAAAKRLQAEIESMPAPAEVVDALERLAAAAAASGRRPAGVVHP